MTVKERVYKLIDALPESDLQVIERQLRGLLVSPMPEQASSPLSREERLAKIQAFRGSLAHLPGSVEEFLRQKHEDTEREEARLERRQANTTEKEAA